MLTRWLRLRYQLQWAAVRRSPRRAAGFALSQMLLVAAVATTGTSTLALVEAGASLQRLPVLVPLALTIWFFNAVAVAVFVGYGQSHTFSDRALRRYPLTARQRALIRHGLALLEPIWLMTITLVFVCACATSIASGTGLGLGLLGAALLVATNYLSATIVVAALDRLAASRAGFVLLMLVTAGAVPAILALQSVASDRASRLAHDAVAWSPPMLAATQWTGASTARPSIALLAWLVGLTVALRIVERTATTPSRRRTAPAWPGWADRLASMVPGEAGAHLSRVLRAYARNPRVQVSALLAFPIAAGLILKQGVDARFGAALLFLPWAGTFVTAGHALNALGPLGGGFNRLMLAPSSLTAIVRAEAVAPLVISAAAGTAAIALWVALGVTPVTPLMVVMLLGEALAVTCVFHAVALLAAVLAPRRTSYRRSLQLELSTGGQAGFAIGLAAIFGLPIVLRHHLVPGPLAPAWWMPWAALPLAVAVHEAAVRVAVLVVTRRKEALARLLSSPEPVR
jgi:hypothetical protein